MGKGGVDAAEFGVERGVIPIGEGVDLLNRRMSVQVFAGCFSLSAIYIPLAHSF